MPRIRRPKSFSCTYDNCDKKFTCQSELNDHIRLHTGETPFRCRIDNCDRSFRTKDLRLRHERTHSDERPFQCRYPQCESSFKTSGGRAQHEKIHDDFKTYFCSYPKCNESYFTNAELIAHKSEHDNDYENRYPCEIDGCDAAFKEKSFLERHMAVHSDDRNYCCSINGCRSAFKLEYQLLYHHQQVHIKFIEYPCTECEQIFKSSEGLKYHLRSHQNGGEIDRPYHCDFPECDANFSLKSSLNVHMNSHSDDRPFACDFENCDFTAKHNSNLYNHKKSFHSPEAQQIRKKQEQKIAKILLQNNIDYKREHVIKFDCWQNDTSARTDFLIMKNNGVIILEIDEDQHESYGVICDVARMSRIFTALTLAGNSLPIGIVRYNPNKYLVNGLEKRMTQQQRQNKLLDVINNWQFGSDGSLEIQYMYYNCDVQGNNIILKIWEDPLYDVVMTECCRVPII